MQINRRRDQEGHRQAVLAEVVSGSERVAEYFQRRNQNQAKSAARDLGLVEDHLIEELSKREGHEDDIDLLEAQHR